jgi:fructose-bisphosphate aldolase class I
MMAQMSRQARLHRRARPERRIDARRPAPYGIPDSAYSGDAEMFKLMHEMRVRIMTAPAFTGDKVIAPSCSSARWTATGQGKPVPTLPVGRPRRRSVPQGRQGAEAEADGVSLMKPIPASTRCWSAP